MSITVPEILIKNLVKCFSCLQKKIEPIVAIEAHINTYHILLPISTLCSHIVSSDSTQSSLSKEETSARST
jgi:hypothetical protein